jgi:hypothetical protein
MKVKNIIFLLAIFFASCNKPSSIEVENNLTEAVITNMKWGDVPLASELLPGKTTGKVKIYEDSHYNLDFPEEFPLNFYLELSGDRVLLETRKTYKLGKEDDILISINDSLEVFNPIKEAK